MLDSNPKDLSSPRSAARATKGGLRLGRSPNAKADAIVIVDFTSWGLSHQRTSFLPLSTLTYTDKHVSPAQLRRYRVCRLVSVEAPSSDLLPALLYPWHHHQRAEFRPGLAPAAPHTRLIPSRRIKTRKNACPKGRNHLEVGKGEAAAIARDMVVSRPHSLSAVFGRGHRRRFAVQEF